MWLCYNIGKTKESKRVKYYEIDFFLQDKE
nr:MAG TPA: hypothetical protein [Caudoviricetes sp.]